MWPANNHLPAEPAVLGLVAIVTITATVGRETVLSLRTLARISAKSRICGAVLTGEANVASGATSDFLTVPQSGPFAMASAAGRDAVLCR